MIPSPCCFGAGQLRGIRYKNKHNCGAERQSAVDGVFLNPVKASAEEGEFLRVLEAELQVGFVAGEVAVEDELIGSWARKGEGGLVFGAALDEGEGVLRGVDGGSEVGARVVHVLENHEVCVVEDDAMPAVVIGEERGVGLVVDSELVDVPDAVEGGFGPAGAVGFPAVACSPGDDAYEPEREESLHDERDAIGASGAEERSLPRGFGGAIEEEEVGEAAEFRREEEQREQDEVQGEQLDRDVVGHVEEEDVGHVGEGDEGAEGHGAGDEEEKAAEQFDAAGGDFVGMGGADGGPEHAHGREVAEGFQESKEGGKRHLERNGFVKAVDEHLAGEREAEKEPEPFVQVTVACPAAIEDGPERGGDEREDGERKDEDEVDGFVAAAATGEDQRSFVVEDVGCGEGDDLTPGRNAGGIGNVDLGDSEEHGDDLRGEAVDAEVNDAEAEGDAGGEAPMGGGGFGWWGIDPGLRAHRTPFMQDSFLGRGIGKSCRKSGEDATVRGWE